MEDTSDMSDLIKQVSSMIEKDEIPDNVKDMLKNFNTSKNNSNTASNDDVSSSANFSGFDGIDINTILKMKTIMDSLNSKDDPRANLLLSLKPYLKDSRKNKVDQYIQFLNMSKLFDMFKNSGGDVK